MNIQSPQSSKSLKEPDDAIHEVDSPRRGSWFFQIEWDPWIHWILSVVSTVIALFFNTSPRVMHAQVRTRRSPWSQNPTKSLNLTCVFMSSMTRTNNIMLTLLLSQSLWHLHRQFAHLSVEGLSQYMITSQSGQCNQLPSSDIYTGERTLWPPPEALRFGLLSSSGNGQSLWSAQRATNLPESPGPNADIDIHPVPPTRATLSHVQVWDWHLGMSISSLERMQSRRLLY